LIEEELEEIGVKAKASYQKGEVEVVFDTEKVTEKNIAETVKNVGYTLQENS